MLATKKIQIEQNRTMEEKKIFRTIGSSTDPDSEKIVSDAADGVLGALKAHRQQYIPQCNIREKEGCRYTGHEVTQVKCSDGSTGKRAIFNFIDSEGFAYDEMGEPISESSDIYPEEYSEKFKKDITQTDQKLKTNKLL
jgi:hypothetical protein